MLRRKVQKPHNYVYFLQWGNFFYLGLRSSVKPPNEDPYLGSGSACYEKWFGNEKPRKIIICDYPSRKEAADQESLLLIKFIEHRLMMNIRPNRCYYFDEHDQPNPENFAKVQSLLREAEGRQPDHLPTPHRRRQILRNGR